MILPWFVPLEEMPSSNVDGGIVFRHKGTEHRGTMLSVGVGWTLFANGSALMQIERVLRDYGHTLRPIGEAPRDGKRILGHAAHSGGLVFCYWEPRPSVLLGACWIEEKDSRVGYLDRYFDGWLDLRAFRLLDSNALNRLLVAHIDDARSEDNVEVLNLLNQAGAS
jgi:hypothetical protein